MSREISVVKFSGTFRTLNQAAEDEHLLALGSRKEVEAAIDAAFGEIDWSDPGWGEWSGAEGTIRFSVGSEDPVESLVLHVDADDAVNPLIVSFCRANDWHATESGMGPFLDQVANTGG
jgi:hypothetical protein